MRNDENAIEKSGLADVGYPAVDDDTRIEYLVRFLRRALPPEDASECWKVEQIAFVGADDESHIRHEEQNEQLDERERTRVEDRVRQHVADQRSSNDTHDRTNRRADEPFQSCTFEPVFEIDDTDGAAEAEGNGVGTFEAKRLNEVRDQR